MKLGEKINILRKSANLSQEQFGELLGVSRQSVSKWETNQSLPELNILIEISKIFGISLDELVLEESSYSQSTLEKIAKMKMKFHFGLLITFVGVGVLVTSMVIHKDLINWYGNIFRLLIVSFQQKNYLEFIYYNILFIIIILGIYICANALGLTKMFKDKLKQFFKSLK